MASRQDIIVSLETSDVDKLRQYMNEGYGSNKIISELYQLEDFNPSDELIDFLLEIGDKRIPDILVARLTFFDHLDRAQSIIPLIKDKKKLLVYTMYSYAEPPFNSKEHSTTKAILIMLLNNLENELILSDITKEYNIPPRGIKIYVLYDAYLYALFRIMNDNMLKTTDPSTINFFTIVAVLNDAPDYLTETLMKYVPDVQALMRKINMTIKPKKPSDYVSLFNDDV